MCSDTPDTPDTPRRPLWQRLVGIRRREGKRLRYVPTVWGWVILVAVVGLGSMAGFAEYSMQPDFCRSCHLMEPYYQAWHASSHNGIPCADCHFEPGWRNTLKGKWEASSQAAKYITDTYGSKPHAEIRDVSCLRAGCHERRLLEGKVEWTVTSQTGHPVTINFDHTPHLNGLRRGKKLRCVSCHSQMVQGQHIVVTLDTCFLCHFKGFKHGRDDQTLGGCENCHTAPKETIRLSTGDFDHAGYIERGAKCVNCHSETIAGDGRVPKQFCWTCHNQPADIERYGDTKLMHDKHVTESKVECSSCHVQIVHNLAAALPTGGPLADFNSAHALGDAGGCGQCHENLHDGAMLLYAGRGGRGVADMPSPMYRTQVDCIACHQTPINTGAVAEYVGQNYRTTQPACDHCHGDEYAGRLDEWKQQLDKQQQAADRLVDRADAALAAAALDDGERLPWQRLLDDAKHNTTLVRYGRGVHNVTYANALLSLASQNAQKVIDALEGDAAR